MSNLQNEIEKLLGGAIEVKPTDSNNAAQDKEASPAPVPQSATPWTTSGTAQQSAPYQTSGPVFNPTAQATAGHLPDARISELLTSKGYHPVLLFGSAAVGKSTLLVSLFTFANFHRDSPSVCRFNDRFFETENISTNEIKARASQLFFKDTVDFQRGAMPERTQAAAPIFVPVDLTPKQQQGGGLSIAFLESAGEHQKADEQTGQVRENSFAEEIRRIFQSFEGPLSIILVAPYQIGQSRYEGETDTVDTADQTEMSNADQALYLSLANYVRVRPERLQKLDNFMFLLTKWDEHTRGPNDEEFLQPQADLVKAKLREKFPMSWNYFYNMPHSNKLRWLHYSAGVITGNIRLTPSDEFERTFGIFPREVWRWIYSNATAAQGLEAAPKPRAGFFKRLFSGSR